jgi:uncharacterized membrane protein
MIKSRLRSRVSTLGLVTVVSILVAAILLGTFGTINGEVVSTITVAVEALLSITVYLLYLVGAGLIVLGSVLITVRYVKSKIKDPFQPFMGLPRARYLTLSLEIIIGAEIIKTIVVRTVDEFLLLILIISSRGLFSLILYLERRWHGATEKNQF